MKEVYLLRRPVEAITEHDFLVARAPALVPGQGEVLTKTLYISLDPYLALRMRREIPDQLSGPPYPIVGRTIGQVIEAGSSGFAEGDLVLGFGRWRTYDARPAGDLRRIDPSDTPPAAYLGALGHSGFTAWLGLAIGLPKASETFVVSGAAGAVGSIAGQLAKQRGCRVIGIAGGAAKCEQVITELGFDDCLDHQQPDLSGRLRTLAPNGIDLHFENVGSKTLDPVLANMRPRSRIVLCGLVQHYQDAAPISFANFRLLLERSIRLEPFSIYDHQDQAERAQQELIAAVRSGSLRFAQTVTEGIDQVPKAFVAMLAGQGTGKHLALVA